MRRHAALATHTDLKAEATQDIAAAMNGIHADVFALYLKTQNFPWSMSRPRFRDYHLLLDDGADALYAMTDLSPSNHGSHAEAVEIIFDPSRISYRQILKFFFQIHDPTTRDRQGNDVGTGYRSAIFYTSDEQRRVAEDTIAGVDASGLWPGKVVTEVAPASDFWEART